MSADAFEIEVPPSTDAADPSSNENGVDEATPLINHTNSNNVVPWRPETPKTSRFSSKDESAIGLVESYDSKGNPTSAARVRAPVSKMTSLDFERVINTYSVRAERARLFTRGEVAERAVQNDLSWSLICAGSAEDNLADKLMRLEAEAEAEAEAGDGFILGSLRASVLGGQSPSSQTSEGGAAPKKKMLRSRGIFQFSFRSFSRWLLICLTGLFTGTLSVLICWCTEMLTGVGLMILDQLQETGNDAANMTSEESSLDKPVGGDEGMELGRLLLVFVKFSLWNLILACASSAMCLWLAPEASGSGIPEMISYLNGVRVKRFADLKLFVVKIVGTVLSVSSGLAVGPEGPLVHLGAIVGSSLTKLANLFEDILHFSHRHFPTLGNMIGCATPTRATEDNVEKGHKEASSGCRNSFFSSLTFHLKYLCNDEERRDLISIGAACGFAAAFGAPVGGVLFSLEEASSYFAQTLLWKTLTATAIATFCLAVYHGNLSGFGIITIETGDNSNGAFMQNGFEEIPLYILVGVGGGLLGALFNGTWKMMFKTRQAFFAGEHISFRRRKMERLAEVAALSLITSALMYSLPMLMSWSCRDVFGDEEDSYLRLNCKEGQFNELGSMLLGPRDEVIKDILKDPNDFDPRSLLAVGLLFYPLYLVTFGVSLPSGIFMPTVLVGSSLGAYLGILFQGAISSDISPSTFGLLGAASLLSGVQRTPVSLCVILVEGTGRIEVLVPVIVTIVVARYVGDLFNHGIYHEAIHLKAYPFLEHNTKKTYDILKVSDVMSCPVRKVKATETAGTIESLLLMTSHHGFPVVDPETGRFLGLVRRDQLVALLELGIFQENHTCRMKSSHDLKRRAVLEREESVFLDYRRNTDQLADDKYDEYAWFRDNVHISRNSITVAGCDALPLGKMERSPERLVTIEGGNLVIQLAPEDRDKSVDIRSIMNLGTHVVTEGCPLSKAHRMFTALGLRYLVVLGGESGGNIVGIITRGNLDPDFIETRAGGEL